MTDSTLLELACGPLLLTLAPGTGGSIARFDWQSESRKTSILRGVEGTSANAVDHASFPLVPFSNRIRGGTFDFRQRQVTLAPNMQGDRSPLHGQGWLSSWETVEAGDRTAEILFRHHAGEWPWDYEARQVFELDEAGLTLVLSCTNHSDAPMPCGLGQHPYFHCTDETVLDTGVESVWTVDELVLPIEKLPAQGRYDMRDRRICGQGLDNGFGGWSGRARIETPGLPSRIELSSPDARFFQCYSPPEGGLFVAEPVSHANAALNEPEALWPELGMRVLEPGETMALTMRLDILSIG